LPWGAVCNFASPEGAVRKTFSYFDPVPFGYANFGPLLTALFTVLLLVLIFLYWLRPRRAGQIALRAVSAVATLTSLMPLIYGLRFFSLVGGGISLLLAIFFGISLNLKTNP